MREERVCGACGRSNALASRFCGNCGQVLPMGGAVLLRESPSGAADVFSEEDTVLETLRRRWQREGLGAPDVDPVPPAPADPPPAAAGDPPPVAGARIEVEPATESGAGAYGTAAAWRAAASAASAAEETRRAAAASAAPSASASSVGTGVGASAGYWGGRRDKSQSPGMCAVLSFFFPGLGQILSKQAVKGVVLLLAAYAAVVYLGWKPFSLPMFIGQVLIALDAYRIAERRRDGRPIGEWDWGLSDRKRRR